MREIILDTETTGFDPNEGHRLIEIGCLELHNHVPTGRTWHQYFNPERDVPAEAVAVHGLTAEMLADKPLFAELVEGFLEFIADSTLVIHNAEFDMRFLNAELRRIGYKALANPPLDTVAMARKMFPGQPASLDALCRRFKIDNSARTFHGALLDAQLLAEVYLEMRGGRQQGLALLETPLRAEGGTSANGAGGFTITRAPRERRHFPVSEKELAAHRAMIDKLGDAAIWKKVQAD